MAEEPWNKVNIPFPSAVSCVRVPVSPEIDSALNGLLKPTNKILHSILQSELLQTEIRLLYGLMYVVKNGLSNTKTFRVLKQVEQCINRLKMMKLEAALQDLKDLCPTKPENSHKREFGTETAEYRVPSQPMLEWSCLKVLGAARLMACVMNHCTRTFIISKQHLACMEFVVVNVVISSLVCRLWVFFRGLLAQLVPLYQFLTELLREVSQARSMPYLTGFSLPADMDEFLGPSDASLLTVKPPKVSRVKTTSGSSPCNKTTKPKARNTLKLKAKKKKSAKKRTKLDFGEVVQRAEPSTSGDIRSLLNISKETSKRSSQETSRVDAKMQFKNQVQAAHSFATMETHIKEMIPWYKSQRLKREECYLSFLQLKCQKMKCLESAGHKVKKKLRSFKQEVCWASDPRGAIPRTCLSVATLWRRSHPKTCIQPTRIRLMTKASRISVKRKRLPSLQNVTASSVPEDTSEPESHQAGTRVSRVSSQVTRQISPSGNKDEIDDIFGSLGF